MAKWVPEGSDWAYTGEEPSMVQLPMTQQHYPPAVQYSPTGWYYPQYQPPEHTARGGSVNLGFMMLAIVSGLITLLFLLGGIVATVEAAPEDRSGQLGMTILFFANGTFWTILWAAFGTFVHRGRGR